MCICPALHQYFSSLLNFKHLSVVWPQDCDVSIVGLITVLYCYKRKKTDILVEWCNEDFFLLFMSETECWCYYFEMPHFLFFLLLTLYICQLMSLSPFIFCVSHFSSSHSTKSFLNILLSVLMISCFTPPVRLHLYPSSFFIYSPPHCPSDPHALRAKLAQL